MRADPVRVLIVDDERAVRRLLRAHFELTDGFECVDEATDSREAVALATLLQPDVIVLDSMMPGVSGLDALPALVDASPRSLLVLFSAVVESTAIGAVRKAGAAGVVPKTSGVEALQAAIEALLPSSV
jgi:two-component system nitrate/nitrite response regulator NarL